MIERIKAALAALFAPAEEAKPAVPRSPRWPAVRKAHLAAHPACEACGGTKCLEVHHLWPVSWPGGRRLELEPSNFAVLCEAPGRSCHHVVGHLCSWTARNPDAAADAARLLAKIRARPYPAKKENSLPPPPPPCA